MFEVFTEMDTDGTGTLDQDELSELARSMGKVFSKREMGEAMRQMDADGSGGVDFQEFITWWEENRTKKGTWVGMLKERQRERAWAGQTKKRLLDAEAKRRGDKPLVSGLATESLNRIFDFVHARRLKMMDLFALMDRDGSQVVDAHELHAALCSLGLQLRQQELMAVVEAMDVDGDGTIETAEFLERMKLIGRQRRKGANGMNASFLPAPSGGVDRRCTKRTFRSLRVDPVCPLVGFGTNRSMFEIPSRRPGARR